MTSTLLAAMLAAALPAAPGAKANDAPRAEVRNVRISTPSISVVREKPNAAAMLVGTVKVEMSFSAPIVRRPILKFTALCEVNGRPTVYSTYLAEPNSSMGLKRGAIALEIKESSGCCGRTCGLPTSQASREAMVADPALFTQCLGKVSKKAFASVVYGSPDQRKGFFNLGRSREAPKLLCYRFELWQNGEMAGRLDSSMSGVRGLYSLPPDWHAWRKHPEMFKYVAGW